MTINNQGDTLRDLDRRIDTVVERVKTMFEPYIPAAVAEILGGPDDTVVTITVERGDEVTTSVYTNRRPAGDVADFDTFLAERGITFPKVSE